jgi:hypothetical protein
MNGTRLANSTLKQLAFEICILGPPYTAASDPVLSGKAHQVTILVP